MWAQQVDVIRGQITGVDGSPIEGAHITATSLSGAVNRNGQSDRNGRYTITFPGGEGDYFVTISRIGYIEKRFEIKRTADQDILVADAKLSTALGLDVVHVVAPRNRVPRKGANSDVGGSERPVNSSTVSAADQGNLAALAASLPGVTLVPGADGDPSGFSVLGLGSDQNNTTLNGSQFGGGNLPRDAAVTSSLATSPYDVSRGGFSGGQLSVQTRPGSNFISRTMSVNADVPALQWTDRAARALGQEFTAASLGGLLSGPIKLDESFFAVSYQLGRKQSALHTLLNTDAAGLETIGIAPDSAQRLISILNRIRVPLTVSNLPSNRTTDQGSFLGTLDLAPSSSKGGTAFNLTMTGSWNRLSPVSSLTTEVPSHSGDHVSWNGMIQARQSTYLWFGLLSETAVILSEGRSSGDSYLAMPSGDVLLASTFPDGTNGIKDIAFGGSAFLGTSSSTSSLGASNQLSWFSANNKHRLKLSTELRRDGFGQTGAPNEFGNFTFASLGALDSGAASSFTRQFQARSRNGGEYVGAIALGDSYKRNADLQFQYGIRLDWNTYFGLPERNEDIARLFASRNDEAPNRIYASPRLGFSWTYGSAPQVGAFDGAVRGPRAVVRGGIGMFQNTPSASLLGNAIANTGLPDATQQVTCTGPATPIPDWQGYLTHAAAYPSQCAAGAAAFTNAAPNVTLLSKDFSTQRSLRSNLQWSGPVGGDRFMLTAEITYSRNMNQPGTVDLNVAARTRFVIQAEGGRPVYAYPSSIDPSSGEVAFGDARVSSSYNRVIQMRSDLLSESKQLTLRLVPITPNSAWLWSGTYVYSSVIEQARGFSGNTGGDPFTIEWARSAFDSHHQFQYSIGYNFFDAVRITWFGNVRSGVPFTPLVSGDVNGDGYANDRAFVYNPATTPDPALASAMHQLLGAAPTNVRDCLMRQLGTVAMRNSCQTPWTTSANLSISFNPLKLGLPQRATLSLFVSNPLGAADLLVHGQDNLHGWGQAFSPDPQLLYVTGFSPATNEYKYTVNQRFGSSNPAFNPLRTPVTVTAQVRIDLGPTRERQSLTQQLNSGRRSRGTRLTADMLKTIYANTGGLVNPTATILRQADTLGLTGMQADSVTAVNRRYVARLDSIWTPVAAYFGALPDRYDEERAYERYRAAREESIDLLVQLAPVVRALLSPTQQRKLPSIVASYLDTRYLKAIRSGTAGAGGNPFGQLIPGTNIIATSVTYTP